MTNDEAHENYAVILDHLTDWSRHDLHPIGRKPTLEEALEAAGKLYKTSVDATRKAES